MTDRPTARDAIIETAAQLIRIHGVQGMSISDIVAESGTSAGAIYHHFPNKQAVFVEVARVAIAWPLRALAEYLDRPASPAELLAFALDAHTASPELGNLLTQLGAGASTDDELGRQLRAEFAVLRDSLERTIQAWAQLNGIPPERVAGYSQLMTGLALGFISQRVLVADFDEATYRRQAVALLELPLASSEPAGPSSGKTTES